MSNKPFKKNPDHAASAATRRKLWRAPGHTVFASMRDVNGKHRDQANHLLKQGIAVVELDVSNDDAATRVPGSYGHLR
jgi:hypothetical protein